MTTLLTAWIDNPSYRNACQLRNYARKHPMAIVLFRPDHQTLIASAIYQADNELI